jgi:hypothetical protein
MIEKKKDRIGLRLQSESALCKIPSVFLNNPVVFSKVGDSEKNHPIVGTKITPFVGKPSTRTRSFFFPPSIFETVSRPHPHFRGKF